MTYVIILFELNNYVHHHDDHEQLLKQPPIVAITKSRGSAEDASQVFEVIRWPTQAELNTIYILFQEALN